jgi:hypothetical protein
VSVSPDESEDGKYYVDARSAQGIQVGEHNTQTVYINVSPGSPVEREVERGQVIANAYNERAFAVREWEQNFGRYQEAREMAASIIDVVGRGDISRSVIVDVTERLATRTPRYWVAMRPSPSPRGSVTTRASIARPSTTR